MAPTNPPYDPIVSVEGMYKGSLTRLGDFFKDPKPYGKATLAVLRETAKRYDNALDDCLIQILDAKWLLEHQLAQNRARRAREAAETETASNKRKLETATVGGPARVQDRQPEENPAKRIKVQHESGANTPLLDRQHETSPKEVAEITTAQENDIDMTKVAKPQAPPVEETGPKAGQPGVKTSVEPPVTQNEKSDKIAEPPKDKPAAAPPEETKEHREHRENREQKELKEQTDFITNDEDMNFESMFGDANTGNDQNNDLNFDLNLNSDSLGGSNPFETTTHDASNLEILPGLESYANASGDDFSMLNLPSSLTASQPAVRATETNLDLPEIQGDSSFNDLLADGDFGGDGSLMDLDLEDGFFNI